MQGKEVVRGEHFFTDLGVFSLCLSNGKTLEAVAATKEANEV